VFAQQIESAQVLTPHRAKLPASGKFSANLSVQKADLCSFCPKLADFRQKPGNFAMNGGNLLVKLFVRCCLHPLFCMRQQATAGKLQPMAGLTVQSDFF
jgi:hypothetical protein